MWGEFHLHPLETSAHGSEVVGESTRVVDAAPIKGWFVLLLHRLGLQLLPWS